MGLCPDCRSEGETVTFVGGSKDEVIDQRDEERDMEETDASTDDEPESEDLPECDLCGTEYESDEG
jgi:hypothetical protein